MKTTTYGAWLKWQRNRRKLTQKQVEEAVGVDHSQYSKWENDRNVAQPDTREKFHAYYGTTDDDLVAAGVLKTYPGINGETNYVYASSITPGDIAAAEARDVLYWRTETPNPSDDIAGRVRAVLQDAGLTSAQFDAVVTILNAFWQVNADTHT